MIQLLVSASKPGMSLKLKLEEREALRLQLKELQHRRKINDSVRRKRRQDVSKPRTLKLKKQSKSKML